MDNLSHPSERFELVFAQDKFLARAYADTELAPGMHYVEFPPEAVWIFPLSGR